MKYPQHPQFMELRNYTPEQLLELKMIIALAGNLKMVTDPDNKLSSLSIVKFWADEVDAALKDAEYEAQKLPFGYIPTV